MRRSGKRSRPLRASAGSTRGRATKTRPRGGDRSAVALIAIDWGTSAARAYRLDARGAVINERSAALGIQKVLPGEFPKALGALLGGEVPSDVPMIACGMIGSRQGWIEAPYRECPVDFAAIAGALTTVPGANLCIVPGIVCRDPDGVPDVMRGEETQIVGALDDAPGPGSAQRVPLDDGPRPGSSPRVVVLPGTHSKWALVRDTGIEAFVTFMTGELYAVLREHSILGRLASSGGCDRAAFKRGVRASLRETAALSHDIFSVRTLALTGALAPEGVGDYLSGLLLGAEIGAGCRWLERRTVRGDSVILLGEAALCQRYSHALAVAGIGAVIGATDAAARGLWRIARASGIVKR